MESAASCNESLSHALELNSFVLKDMHLPVFAFDVDICWL